MKQADRAVIERMIRYCEEIERFMDRFGKRFDDYCGDQAYQYATSMCVIQIGELVARLSNETLLETPSIPWRLIRGMRNIYAHNYDRTKPETMWQTLTEDIPQLRSQLQELLISDSAE